MIKKLALKLLKIHCKIFGHKKNTKNIFIWMECRHIFCKKCGIIMSIKNIKHDD